MIGAVGPSLNHPGYVQAPPRRQQHSTPVPGVPSAPPPPGPVYAPGAAVPSPGPAPVVAPSPYVAPDGGAGAMFAPAQTTWLGYDTLPGKPQPIIEADDDDDDEDDERGGGLLANLLGIAIIVGAVYGTYRFFTKRKRGGE